MGRFYTLGRIFAYWVGFLVAFSLVGACIAGSIKAVIAGATARKNPRSWSMTLVIAVGYLAVATLIAVLIVWVYGGSIRS